ncbi:MAG: DNA polymerase III subunit alpha [Armatimonadetes bacterium]|nr:DNA polymerase III subunit alpha [Armatimonadota bacterium]
MIARDELSNYVPLCKVSGGEDIVTQFDMGAVDKIGLLKMDFLGLRTMTVIDEACRLIRENHAIPDFDVRTLGFDDARTYELISRGDVIGVFKLESGGFQRVCRDLRPDCIEDIVALVALYRPGPMDNIPEFIARKHGEKRVQYKHPLLEPILDNTYGIIVYQEQVMQIGRDLAGFSLGEADQIRKAVGKKDAAVMAKVREKFIAGCETNGIAGSVANDLMNEIEQFASYAFNKAHSACYAVIAYWTAYLKANYPHEFMAAQLTSVMDNRDKVVTFVQDTRGVGIDVLPPCVNTGGARFEVHESHIVYGMAAINGIGVKVAEAIAAERDSAGAYADLYDLCRRVDPQALPKAAVEKLVRAGACRAFGNRRQLLDGYELIYEAAQRARADERSGQQSLFADMEEELGADVRSPRLKPISEFSRDQLREHDVELLGLVLFENPYGDLNAKLAGSSGTRPCRAAWCW